MQSNKRNCFSCDNQELLKDLEPCLSCPVNVIVYTNWKLKESPAWKTYVDQKVKEQMQNLYKAFEEVPDDCQQARFIKGLDAPKSCLRCGLGPCPNGISIKGMNL
jgi:hypothetical protein